MSEAPRPLRNPRGLQFSAENPHVTEDCPICGPIVSSAAYKAGYAAAVEALKMLDRNSVIEIEESNT